MLREADGCIDIIHAVRSLVEFITMGVTALTEASSFGVIESETTTLLTFSIASDTVSVI